LFVVLAQLSVAAAGGMFAIAAVSTPIGSPVQVVPTAGGPRTVFLLRFMAPDRTGIEGAMQRFDFVGVSAAGTGTRRGCLTGIHLQLPAASKGSLVRIQLPDRVHRTGWCPGVYRGAISEYERPVCRPGKPCPTYVRLLRRIGRFTLTVQARLSPAQTVTSTTTTAGTTPTTTASDTAAPTFAGLQTAFACTPGPQRPGETTPFRLSWQPASDNATPGSEIIYDVYLATTPGGESFSTPTWTTAPGATSFETPGLPSHGSFYFVVRARDSAGNGDHNTTEIQGRDPCV
jgi:hypothetical protein